MNTILWILAIVLGVSLVVQGIVLRNAYRRKLALQQALQLRFQQEMNGRLEQTKRQISQLQNDLAAARQQLKQLGKGDAALVQDNSPARQALERELDEATALRPSLPVDGFADTLPSPQDPKDKSLLLR
jgi:septal ring factor EnvC (AmiA/AmiB activator)